MTRYDSADAEWADELAVRGSAYASPEPPLERHGRDALRVLAPRSPRDANGRVHPLVDWQPGRDIW